MTKSSDVINFKGNLMGINAKSRQGYRSTDMLLLMVGEHSDEEFRPASHSVTHDVVFFRVFHCSFIGLVIGAGDGEDISSLSVCEESDHFFDTF